MVSSPNEAACISGQLFSSSNKKYISGGWGWAWWCISDTKRIPISVITLHPRCEKVETSSGVPLFIDGIAQVRVMYDENDKTLLKKACENFMGRSYDEMVTILTSTLDGHLRGIVGQMTPTQVFQDREKFAEQVADIASPDLAKMGIQLISFVVQKIEDNVEYFSSIGRGQTAIAKKDATIGEVDAKMESDIVVADCERERVKAQVFADTNISDYEKDYLVVKYQCKTQADKERVIAKLAYDTQKYKELQTIREEEIKVDVLKVGKEIEIAEAEVRRKETELVATVKQPAEYDFQKVGILAKGDSDAEILRAEAIAERIKLLGQAEADSIRAIGCAEANAMKVKAEAMSQWGKAAIIQMVLEALPGFAAEVAAPLEKISEIVVLGGESDRKPDSDEMAMVLNTVKGMSIMK